MKNKKKKSQDTNLSPLNKSKIKALAEIYYQLPSNSFSKLTVTFCLLCATIIIITSFVFIYLGFDPSDITAPALLFFGGELVALSATVIFDKERAKNNLMLSQIEKDINDGYLYDANGNIVGKEGQMLNSNTNTGNTNTTTNTGNTTNNYYSVNNTNTNTNTNLQDDSSFYNTNPDPSGAQGLDEEFEELEELKEESTEETQKDEIKEPELQEDPKPQPKKRGRPRKTPEPKTESKPSEPEGYSSEYGSVDDDGRD